MTAAVIKPGKLLVIYAAVTAFFPAFVFQGTMVIKVQF